MLGQINRGSSLGEYIYDISSRDDVNSIVEIGTWNGCGSTRCVIDAIKGKDKQLTTVELHPNQYVEAVANVGEYAGVLSNVKMLNGSVINHEDAFWFDHSIITDNPDDHASLWYEIDMNYLKDADNILDQIPSEIDLLILDGGEYTTYPEYVLLKDRSKIICLDDTNTFKCAKILAEIGVENDFQSVVVSYERNGFAIFERITK
jgi:hypothetical protein